jgi:hypothetical protein
MVYRDKKFKLVREPDSNEFLLYNLQRNPEETVDESANYPSRIQNSMKTKMEQLEQEFLAPAAEDGTCPSVTRETTSWGDPV